MTLRAQFMRQSFTAKGAQLNKSSGRHNSTFFDQVFIFYSGLLFMLVKIREWKLNYKMETGKRVQKFQNAKRSSSKAFSLSPFWCFLPDLVFCENSSLIKGEAS